MSFQNIEWRCIQKDGFRKMFSKEDFKSNFQRYHFKKSLYPVWCDWHFYWFRFQKEFIPSMMWLTFLFIQISKRVYTQYDVTDFSICSDFKKSLYPVYCDWHLNLIPFQKEFIPSILWLTFLYIQISKRVYTHYVVTEISF